MSGARSRAHVRHHRAYRSLGSSRRCAPDGPVFTIAPEPTYSRRQSLEAESPSQEVDCNIPGPARSTFRREASFRLRCLSCAVPQLGRWAFLLFAELYSHYEPLGRKTQKLLQKLGLIWPAGLSATDERPSHPRRQSLESGSRSRDLDWGIPGLLPRPQGPTAPSSLSLT